MKTTKIKIPIYFGKLVILRAKNFKEIESKFGFDSTNSYASFTFKRVKKNGAARYYIALKKNTSNSVIAHEVVHLVNYIFDHNGIELDLKNDEAQAYLTGWIFEQISKYIKS